MLCTYTMAFYNKSTNKKLLAKLKAPAWKQVLCFLFYNYYGNVCIFYDGLANAVSEQTF